MEAKLKFIFITIFFSIIITIFKNWVISSEIIGGDWPYWYSEVLIKYPVIPYAWNTWFGNGFGGVDPAYFLHIFENVTIAIANFFSLSWAIVYKITWFSFFLGLSVASSFIFMRVVFPKLPFPIALLSSLIYLTNSYILMVVGGGQMGVALAYSVLPLMLRSGYVITATKQFSWYETFVFGFSLSLLVLFDPRIAYIGILILGFLLLFFHSSLRTTVLSYFLGFGITIMLHLSWIMPIIFFRGTTSALVESVQSSEQILRFFSFATFSQTFSFLHPNWPENIFGKVYFMRFEFLLIPFVAFLGMFYLQHIKEHVKKILAFSLLAFIGVFLAKGTQEPFGEVYLWLFQYLPGFFLFRDPTKWYMVIAIAYSVLIPVVLYYITVFLTKKIQFFSQSVSKSIFFVSITFLAGWLLLIREAPLQKLGGTFLERSVPQEYQEIAQFIEKQPEFFRTLWVPRMQRFGISSFTHPAVEAQPLLETTDAQTTAAIFKEKKDLQQALASRSIKYVIIPHDALGEIFLKERKYDRTQRDLIEKTLDDVSWLRKIHDKDVTIYELSYLSHIRTEGKNNSIVKQVMHAPVTYSITMQNEKPTSLIVSENYNPHWIAKTETDSFYPQKTENGLMQFTLDKVEGKMITLEYQPQKYYTLGYILSAFLFVLFSLTLVVLKLKNHEKK